MPHKKGSLPRERYMTVLGGYTLDMHNHGHLVRQELPARVPGQDYGCTPIGKDDNGVFQYRMVPSGDIVDYAERCRRLDNGQI